MISVSTPSMAKGIGSLDSILAVSMTGDNVLHGEELKSKFHWKPEERRETV